MSEQNAMTEHDHYWFELIDMASLIKEYGTGVLLDLKRSFPEEYKTLQMAVLNELPK